MILVVSGVVAEEFGASMLELEEFVAIHEELLEFVIPAPEPESSLEEETLSGAHEELETSSAEVLLPSSPQATIPKAATNTPNKLNFFISPSLLIVNIIDFSPKSCRCFR